MICFRLFCRIRCGIGSFSSSISIDTCLRIRSAAATIIAAVTVCSSCLRSVTGSCTSYLSSVGSLISLLKCGWHITTLCGVCCITCCSGCNSGGRGRSTCGFRNCSIGRILFCITFCFSRRGRGLVSRILCLTSQFFCSHHISFTCSQACSIGSIFCKSSSLISRVRCSGNVAVLCGGCGRCSSIGSFSCSTACGIRSMNNQWIAWILIFR